MQNRIAEFHTELELLPDEVGAGLGSSNSVAGKLKRRSAGVLALLSAAVGEAASLVRRLGRLFPAVLLRPCIHIGTACPRRPLLQLAQAPELAQVTELEQWLMEGAYNKVRVGLGFGQSCSLCAGVQGRWQGAGRAALP